MAQPSEGLRRAQELAEQLAEWLQAPGADPAGLAHALLEGCPAEAALLVASRLQQLEASHILPGGLRLHQFVLALRRSIFGERHAAVAATLQHLALGHCRMEAFTEAETLLREAASICRSLPQQTGLTAILADLGTVLARLEAPDAEDVLCESQERQRAETAHPLDQLATTMALRDLHAARGNAAAWDGALSAIPLADQAHGARSPQAAMARLEAALLGEFAPAGAEAVRLANEGVTILQDPACEGPERWRALLLLGRWHMRAGLQEASRQACVAAIAALEAQENAAEEAQIDRYLALGDWALRFSAPPVARPFFDTAHSLALALAGPPAVRLADILVRRAAMFQQLGQSAEARADLLEALRLRRNSLGNSHSAVAETHQALGAHALESGDYAAAQAHLEEAMALRQPARPPVLLGLLARLASDLGDQARALRLYGEAKPSRSDAAEMSGALASTLLRAGRAEDAEALIQEALIQQHRAAGTALGRPHAVLAATLCQAGALAAMRGDHARSSVQFARATDLLDRLYGRTHPDLATALLGQAAASLALGAPDAALDLAASALARGGPLLPAETQWRLYALMADTLATLGRRPEAIAIGKRAVNLLQSIRTALAPLPDSMQAHFLGGRHRAYQDAADRLIAADRLPEAQQIVAILKTAELRAALRGPAWAHRSTLSTPEAHWDAEIERRLAAIHAVLTAQAQVGDGIPALPEHRAALAELDGPLRAAERAWFDWIRTPVAAPALPPTPAATSDMSRLQARLAASEPAAVALDYVVLPDRLEIIVTTASDQSVVRVSIGEHDLRRHIFAFWLALRDRTPDAEGLAKSLYRVLFAPVEAAASGASLVLLQVTGALRFVPFAALHDGTGPLAWRYGFATRATAVAASNTRRNTGPAALFANAQPYAGTPGLSHVTTEISEIARILPGATCTFDAAFTAARLRARLADRPRYVHLASHFLFLPAQEWQSALLLGDGSLLRAAELADASFHVDGIELLTLSACETALAATGGGVEAALGREVESLPAALLSAGVGCVMASLWPVDDAGTARLMTAFYRNFWEGRMPVAMALRQAQIAVGRPEPAAGATRGVFVPNQKPKNDPPSPVRKADLHQWAAFVLFVAG